MKKYLLCFLILFSPVFFVSRIFALSPEEVVKQEIDALENKMVELGKQKNTLSSQIISMDSQVKLTTLKISQTEEQIVVLSNKISRLEVSLDSLAVVLGKRIVETYKKGSLDPFSLLFSSSKFSDFVSRYKYLKVMQAHDRQLLFSMEETKTSYDDQKNEIEKLKAKLESQKKLLAQQKKEKENLLVITKGDEKKYQQLLLEARAQLAAMQRYVTSQGGATILSNQTKCNDWGCYYNQRDSEWGNLSLGGSKYSVAGYGCLISSVSMLASHYKKNIKPSDIAVNPGAFVPNEGDLLHSFSVNSISVSITVVSASKLDEMLNSGPVIAGLYSGPDHFIVILKKEGSNYIMHDPFLENGANRPLSDKYSVSNITSLRLVKFN
jgi:peptidoglycan hydrolase CwlO-like protein